MSDEGFKVNDKRMFNPDGELREEYRFLEEETRQAPEEPAAPEPSAAPADRAEAPGERPAAGAQPEPGPGTEEPTPGAPGFLDLLGVLAEPVPYYLGDAPLPTGERQENLEAARFYIDLIDTLKQKTAGNLTAQEADALEDVLHQLRIRYVQKSR